MAFAELFVISVVLGTDAFSMALGLGTRDYELQENVKISSVIGIFHIIMPLIGIYVGRLLGSLFNEFAVYFGALILIVLGGHMIYEHLADEKPSFDIESMHGAGLFILAFGVSLDALSVGMSLGTRGVDLIGSAVFIGLTALVMTAFGLSLGHEFGKIIGRHSELFGGMVLIVLGLKIFFE